MTRSQRQQQRRKAGLLGRSRICGLLRLLIHIGWRRQDHLGTFQVLDGVGGIQLVIHDAVHGSEQGVVLAEWGQGGEEGKAVRKGDRQQR